MKLNLHNVYRVTRRIDISPLGKNYRLKIFIYFFWGFNALLFLAKDIAVECTACTDVNCTHQVACTVVKKIVKSDIYLEEYEFVSVSFFVTIPTEQYILPETDFSFPPKDRSPPLRCFILRSDKT